MALNLSMITHKDQTTGATQITLVLPAQQRLNDPPQTASQEPNSRPGPIAPKVENIARTLNSSLASVNAIHKNIEQLKGFVEGDHGHATGGSWVGARTALVGNPKVTETEEPHRPSGQVIGEPARTLPKGLKVVPAVTEGNTTSATSTITENKMDEHRPVLIPVNLEPNQNLKPGSGPLSPPPNLPQQNQINFKNVQTIDRVTPHSPRVIVASARSNAPHPVAINANTANRLVPIQELPPKDNGQVQASNPTPAPNRLERDNGATPVVTSNSAIPQTRPIASRPNVQLISSTTRPRPALTPTINLLNVVL